MVQWSLPPTLPSALKTKPMPRHDCKTMKMVGSGACKSEADAEKTIQNLTECNS